MFSFFLYLEIAQVSNESLSDTWRSVGAFNRSLHTLFASRECANRINVFRDRNDLIVHLIGLVRLSPQKR